jgi:endonuclease/exonuclease/phosphatase family metal-dependent hydrolase
MQTREEALKILRKNADATVIIGGDFNDDHDEASLTAGLGAVTNRMEAAKSAVTGKTPADFVFYNLLGDISPANRKEVPGSYYYARRKMWNTIDAVIVQPRMLIPAHLPGPAWRVPPQERHRAMTFALPEMRDETDGRPKSYRRVRITGKPDNYYEDGHSDHFPVLVELVRTR